jgi:nicotinamidase-related amidase
MLTHLQVDTVILSGLTTSGCIQAAALDAASNNLRVIVPEECVGDRAPTFHRYALFNIDMRYGDVMPIEQVKEYLRQIAPSRKEESANRLQAATTATS